MKNYFRQNLFDQLPPIQQVARALDEIVIMNAPVNVPSVQAGLMIEQVPELTESITGNRDDQAWKSLAETQLQTLFLNESSNDRIQFAKRYSSFNLVFK